MLDTTWITSFYGIAINYNIGCYCLEFISVCLTPYGSAFTFPHLFTAFSKGLIFLKFSKAIYKWNVFWKSNWNIECKILIYTSIKAICSKYRILEVKKDVNRIILKVYTGYPQYLYTIYLLICLLIIFFRAEILLYQLVHLKLTTEKNNVRQISLHQWSQTQFD